jgi:hypothetical protein
MKVNTLLMIMILLSAGILSAAVSMGVAPDELSLSPAMPLQVSETEGETPCVHVSRSVPAGKYTPGKPLAILVKIEEQCEEEFSSIGFIEEIPKNWSFVGMETRTGEAPVIFPPEDMTGTLGFAWITVPLFPVEIQYTIKPQAVSEEPLVISGHALYRFDAGEHRSATVTTTVEALPIVPEGEGELSVEGESVPDEGEAPVGCCQNNRVSDPKRGPGGTVASLIGDFSLLILAVSCMTLYSLKA